MNGFSRHGLISLFAGGAGFFLFSCADFFAVTESTLKKSQLNANANCTLGAPIDLYTGNGETLLTSSTPTATLTLNNVNGTLSVNFVNALRLPVNPFGFSNRIGPRDFSITAAPAKIDGDQFFYALLSDSRGANCGVEIAITYNGPPCRSGTPLTGTVGQGCGGTNGGVDTQTRVTRLVTSGMTFREGDESEPEYSTLVNNGFAKIDFSSDAMSLAADASGIHITNRKQQNFQFSLPRVRTRTPLVGTFTMVIPGERGVRIPVARCAGGATFLKVSAAEQVELDDFPNLSAETSEAASIFGGENAIEKIIPPHSSQRQFAYLKVANDPEYALTSDDIDLCAGESQSNDWRLIKKSP